MTQLMDRESARSAFQYGLLMFTLTALIGLANATQIFGALDRATLLTHLHSGTLAWITMGVIGLAIWMFGGSGMNTAVRLSAATTAAYVLAFWSNSLLLRATFGVAEMAVVLFWWWWVVSRGMREGFGRLDIPKLCLVFGLTTLAFGSLIGVAVQVILAAGNAIPTGTDLVGAHASAQTGGYLVLVAAGVIEWQLRGAGSRSRAGLVQVGLLFIGGLVLSFSLLLASQLGPTLAQALPGIATLFTLAGSMIVAVRLGKAVMGVSWSGGGQRHIAIAIPFLIAAVIFQFILVQQFIAAQGNIAGVSIGLLHSLDHAYFVGLMTNVLFGSILLFMGDGPRSWPWADGVIFWGMNVGATAFIVAMLVAGSGEAKAAFSHPVAFTAPIMGLSALLGVATLLSRLQGRAGTQAAPARG